ncbi:hypothetical protein [Novosphingobium cyanobacteriorum]|uniref:Uncharacterized protein n=1 Tax=Novosphingobium cyanobacteriorum TaxID=3024215 RepID=A0ABT6CJC5_9SPHN|nr:hypothetical protein [Novosphingobium cyanobacteriorum]MDF8333668.1 hypothetical protein [Novosphingobium cyanobacteriorum]
MREPLAESGLSRSNLVVRSFRLIKPDGVPVRYYAGKDMVFFNVRDAARWLMPGWRIKEIKGRRRSPR